MNLSKPNRKHANNNELSHFGGGVFGLKKMSSYKLENGSGTYEKNYVHIMDDSSRIAMARIGDQFPDDINDAITYMLEDQIGSSVARLSKSGTVIDREEYYPFGDSSLRTFSKKRYRYTGKEKDLESGLYYYGARYYSAWTCRFISVDPKSTEQSNFTPYLYANNNPIRMNDPSGMEAEGGEKGGGKKTDNIKEGDPEQYEKDKEAAVEAGKSGEKVEIKEEVIDGVRRAEITVGGETTVYEESQSESDNNNIEFGGEYSTTTKDENRESPKEQAGFQKEEPIRMKPKGVDKETFGKSKNELEINTESSQPINESQNDQAPKIRLMDQDNFQPYTTGTPPLPGIGKIGSLVKIFKSLPKLIGRTKKLWRLIKSTTFKDWLRRGKTNVPPHVTGKNKYIESWALKGGGKNPRSGVELPYHFHIHKFNWYKPWKWFGH